MIYESPLLELLSRTFEFYWQRAMQRRIRGLMQSLGVRTRFQAGLLVGRIEGSGRK